MGKTRWLFCLLTLSACDALPGAEPPPPEEPVAEDLPAAPEAPLRNLYLWEVTKDGAASDAWLMGSIHVGRTAPQLDERIWSAFTDSDFLAVEVDTDDADPEELQKKARSFGFYKRGKTLRRSIGDTLYQRVESMFRGHKLSVKELNRAKPWYAYLTLSNMESRAQGVSPTMGLDVLFMRHARTVKPIKSLETVETQLGALSGASETLQIAMLSNFIVRGATLNTDNIDDLIDAYYAADDAVLLQSSEAGRDSPELAEYLDKMLDKRNVGMANQIKRYMEKPERGFVVMGAAHLLGNGSVVQLLQDDGYTLTRQVELGEVADIPLRAAADRPLATGYEIEWGGEPSPPMSRWRDNKLMEVRSARSGRLLIKFTMVPLTKYERDLSTNKLLKSVCMAFEEGSGMKTKAKGPYDVDGTPGIELELRGRGAVVNALITASDSDVYIITTFVRSSRNNAEVQADVQRLFDSFAFKL